ncbi:MAG: aminotransferase class I/II-fold pyridoxal phosphate-dependent enzyme [Gammaproteobacteria bacterium]|nr:aminotransferase class I/II-fold pyridoxal phosphate-dependent enzyme [Gammaproteobacteria bacterium]
MTSVIDLRSDTVTRPTPAMRAAMAAAEVGDDQFGEDPTINALQEQVAELLGKEAALWLPTGTMANQLALLTLTHPGDDVIVSRESHAVWHEAGASGANAHVQFTEAGGRGGYTRAEFLAAVKPAGHMLYPATTLAEIENTHNRAGGLVVPHEDVEAVCAAARSAGIATYMDGARLWNAAIASGRTPREVAGPVDVVSGCFSKGLGSPAGSILAGPRDVIHRALRCRRRLGGAMRQVGILAAAAQHALAHHYERLAEDHANARRMAAILAQSPRVQLDPASVQTNIIVFGLAPEGPDAAAVLEAAKARGVLAVAFGPRILRVVTHLDVTTAQCERAAEVIAEIIGG